MKALKKSCWENEIIHIISHLLIRENPTVKRQEMKPGNKFQSCSCKSKFIFSAGAKFNLLIMSTCVCSIRVLQRVNMSNTVKHCLSSHM